LEQKGEVRRFQTIVQLLQTNLYPSQIMITLMKSRRTESAANVARVEAMRYVHKILLRKPEKKSSLDRCWRSGSVI
jgi:hypothetical protein